MRGLPLEFCRSVWLNKARMMAHGEKTLMIRHTIRQSFVEDTKPQRDRLTDGQKSHINIVRHYADAG